MKPILFLVLALALCTGCASERMHEETSASAKAASVQVAQAEGSSPEAIAAGATAPQSDAAPPRALPRKIIYTGEVALVTENLEPAVTALEQKIKEFGGYVSNASRSGVRGETREGSWTVRVPSERFDAFVRALPSLGELQSSSRKADDVSEEFYDVQARLKNKRIEEARLIELLQKATGRLTEVLTVEKELTRVREEIERIEGRLRFLTNQTDLSTVTVTLREVKNFVPDGPPTLSRQLGRAFDGSMDTLRSFGIGLLVLVVSLLPWVAPLALIAFVTLRMTRRWKR